MTRRLGAEGLGRRHDLDRARPAPRPRLPLAAADPRRSRSPARAATPTTGSSSGAVATAGRDRAARPMRRPTPRRSAPRSKARSRRRARPWPCAPPSPTTARRTPTARSPPPRRTGWTLTPAASRLDRSRRALGDRRLHGDSAAGAAPGGHPVPSPSPRPRLGAGRGDRDADRGRVEFTPGTEAEAPWLFEAAGSQLDGEVFDGRARFADGEQLSHLPLPAPAGRHGRHARPRHRQPVPRRGSTDNATWRPVLRRQRHDPRSRQPGRADARPQRAARRRRDALCPASTTASRTTAGAPGSPACSWISSAPEVSPPARSAPRRARPACGRPRRASPARATRAS